MPGTRPGMTRWSVSVPLNGLNRRSSLRLRLGLLRSEGGLEIVEQLNLHTIAVHDEALLQYRQRIVPRPVDHQTRREAREHEGEDHRHPAEDNFLGRIAGRRCG